jgi:hypothetical protein
MNHIDLRIKELMLPVERQIMMCDNRNDLLLLCFSMINISAKILEQNLGAEKKRQLFKEHS